MKERFEVSGTIHQALVALDLTEMDTTILNYLKYFTKAVPTEELHFLHVLPEYDVLKSPYFNEREELLEAWQLNDAAWEAIQKETLSVLGSDNGRKLSFESLTGNPLKVILTKAKEHDFDLLVIGDKDQEDTRGSLVRNIVRRTTCPVLFVPEDPEKELDNILVPIDFSDNSARALKTAVAMAASMPRPPKISCLNVYTLPEVSPYFLSRSRKEFKHMMEENVKDAFERFLDKHVPQYKENIQILLEEKLQPSISKYILEYADENDFGLIVLGAKGHSLVERLLLGTVTENILSKDEEVPVLVVK